MAPGLTSFVCRLVNFVHWCSRAIWSGQYTVVFLTFLLESLGFARSLILHR